MKTKGDKTEQIIFKLNKDLKNAFEKFCEENGYTFSTRIRLLIERDIENGKK